MRPLIVLCTACFLFAQPPAAGPADTPQKQLEYTKAHYTKYDYRIPMRDGIRLFTSVYVPKDRSQTYPILMQRTPYSVAPYGVDNYRNFLGPVGRLHQRGHDFRLSGRARTL